MQGEANIHIKAAPDAVYAIVADITRMGELSPECVKAEWADGASGPAVGAKFKGHNKLGRFVKWSTTPEVTEVDPGRVFAFKTKDTIWRYRFEAAEGGTDVIESFETTSYKKAMQLIAPEKKRQPTIVEGMHETLRRLKAIAEA